MPHESTATGKKSSAKSVATKPAAVKSATKKTPATRVRTEPSGAVNDDDRRNMIATTAYYRAERRGFNGGCEMEDWLEAEAEVDAMLYH